MELRKPYIDINDTMKHIKMQIQDGIPYAKKNIPELSTPEHCFWWLKRRITYKNDPKNIELLQSLPTLLNKNFHGISGAGDCDCFTIAICSILIANNFDNIKICLVGRKKTMPVHIYVCIYDRGTRKVLDLTNPKPLKERSYPFIQELPLNWKNWN